MRDFRIIRKFELEWKDAQHKLEGASSALKGATESGEGGGLNLEAIMEALEDN